MQLSPAYKAERHRRQAQDCIDLAMKAHGERSLALLIDTAIESGLLARLAKQEGLR